MKTTVFAVVTLLLAVIEVSAQPAGGGAKRCSNGGYKGNVRCCDVNSASARQERAAVTPPRARARAPSRAGETHYTASVFRWKVR